jgi:DNA-binding beta-propeller fold protein YncE
MRSRLYRKIVLSGVCPALALTTALLAGPATAALAGDGRSPPLVLEVTIPLEAVVGRIDHMAVDLDKQRLLVAELGNNTVDVIDLKTQRAIHRIKGLHEPQGVGNATAAGAIVVANGIDGSIAFFRADDFAPLGSVELGEDADNVRVDARTGRVVVGYGSGALAIIDPAARSKIADIALAAHPEGFQLTRDGIPLSMFPMRTRSP